MKRFRVLRYIAYTIEIIVFFIIQQTPGPHSVCLWDSTNIINSDCVFHCYV